MFRTSRPPYAIAVVSRPHWPAAVKKWIAIGAAVVLGLVVLAFYYVYTGDVIPQWHVLLVLAVIVVQAAYTLVTKPTASRPSR